MSVSANTPTRPLQRFHGSDLGRNYGADESPYMVTRALQHTEIAVTELLVDRPPGWTSDTLPREDAYIVACQFQEKAAFEYWEEGRVVGFNPLRKGDVTIHDLKRQPTATIDGPLHSMLWFLPRAALNALADEANVPYIEELHFDPCVGVVDEAIHHLSVSLLPALRTPEQVSRLFVDHVTLAFAAHVAQAYGEMVSAAFLVKGGLAPWQERRSKEILAADLSGATPLAEVAAACGLSASHFSRAFRKSTGHPPHAWLMRARVEHAMTLLRQPEQPLSEIALACGFVDQSHLSRVFVQRVGMAPGAWRKLIVS